MKTGRTIQELAVEVQRQAKTKRDYIAPENKIAMQADGDRLSIESVGDFGISGLFHHQLAEHLNIPFKYYELMQAKNRALLATNVNSWLATSSVRRMVRTLDNRARAYLSSRYRPLDNIDLVEAVLPKLSQFKLDVKSCEITETRLYLKCISEQVKVAVVGDEVCAGVLIANSEVGCHSLQVEPFTMTLACLNGMVHENFGIRKFHLGGNGGDGEGAREFYRDATRIQDDKAFFMKVQDVVEATMTPETFGRVIEGMQKAATKQITGKTDKVVEVTAKRYGLSDTERDSVLKHLIAGGQLNAYGLGQALTRVSADVENYDKATDLERAGGEIITLGRHDWEEINRQAA